MIYNYNNNNSAIKKNAQPGAGTLAHGAMGKPEPIPHLPSLCIHLCLSVAIFNQLLPPGGRSSRAPQLRLGALV